MRRASLVVSCLALTFTLAGCSGDAGTSGVSGTSTGATSSSGTGPDLNVGGSQMSGGGTNGSGGSPANQVVQMLPPGYTKTDIGGYQLGAMVGSAGMPAGGMGGGPANGNCGNILLGVSRDFKNASAGGHPDFDADIAGDDVTPNLVSTMLGMDQKPVYTSKCEIGGTFNKMTCPFGAQTTTAANFNQWYNDSPGINMSYTVSIYLAPQPGGLFTFQSLHYFPLDGAGFMEMANGNDGKPHNFGFTTELHTQFLYQGGETFKFQGDDDVWVFINKKLAVDLGGLHPAQLRSVSLDQSATMLGIQKGTIYSLDLFHAERHTSASTFRIDTNLSFTDCGTVIPGKPPK